MNDKIKQILQEREVSLECVEGLDINSRPIYAYLLIKKNNLKAFRDALAISDVNLSDFGIVVNQGYEKTPPSSMDEKIINLIKN